MLLAIALLAVLPGCFPKPVAPIPVLSYPNPNPAPPGERKLLIFLRGIWGGPQIFEEHGLVREVVERRLPMDMVAPDTHFGYFQDESFGRRLEEDVIRPARTRGYREIWIVGTSLGGLGALMYLTEYPQGVDGVILINPFLGWDGVVDEIRAAGGISSWTPGPTTTVDWERYLWAWIKGYVAKTDPTPPLYLAFGAEDYFVDGDRELAKSLPPTQILILPGGHTYQALRDLWAAQLDRLDIRLRR